MMSYFRFNIPYFSLVLTILEGYFGADGFFLIYGSIFLDPELFLGWSLEGFAYELGSYSYSLPLS